MRPEKLDHAGFPIFAAIEGSSLGYPSERDIRGLFSDFDTTSNRLGNTVKDKNSRLAAVLKGVADLDFGTFDDSHIDLFGDAYEFPISNYAANAGKSGGEFFTPQQVSKPIAQLPRHEGLLTHQPVRHAAVLCLLQPAFEVVPQPVGQMPWGHVRTLLAKVKSVELVLLYAQACSEHGWSL